MQYEFVWVNDFIRDNSFHSAPSFRQQMLSHLKHFLYHVLESSRRPDSLTRHPAKVHTPMLDGREELTQLPSDCKVFLDN